MDEYVRAVILDDKAPPLLGVEPLDPPMEFAVVVKALGASIAGSGRDDIEATVAHLALLFDGEDELLAAFLTGDRRISVVHWFLLTPPIPASPDP
jgi:hypothetical protein